jgi:2-polyprenyl-3-methyl-5-hydroxy-6-metoxy-1,4-benzoquinol methylase
MPNDMNGTPTKGRKPNTDFDTFAKSFKSIHTENVRIFGEESDYFIKLKLDILTRAFNNTNFSLDKVTVLDVGCGIGRLEEQILSRGLDWKVYGSDKSLESLRIAQKNLSAPMFSFIRAEGTALAFTEESFDLVLAICVFHHIPRPERPYVMHEIHRILRPGGIVALFEHNPLNPLTRYVVKHCEFDTDAELLSLRETKGLYKEACIATFLAGYCVFFPRVMRCLRFLERQFLYKLPIGGQYYCFGQKAR